MMDEIFFEDLRLGQKASFGKTITEADIVLFAAVTGDTNPMHLNAEYARAHGHPDVVVNPMLVLCTVVGLSVEDLSEAGGPFLGVDDCTFHRPVHPGDTVTASSEVVAMRTSDSRPGDGIVTWHTSAWNQHGEQVVDFRRTNLVRRDR